MPLTVDFLQTLHCPRKPLQRRPREAGYLISGRCHQEAVDPAVQTRSMRSSRWHGPLLASPLGFYRPDPSFPMIGRTDAAGKPNNAKGDDPARCARNVCSRCIVPAGTALHIAPNKSEGEPTSGRSKRYGRGHLVPVFRGIERKFFIAALACISRGG